jgi:FKBP-type peptidyl-prolyl cis-trans isomerase 2
MRVNDRKRMCTLWASFALAVVLILLSAGLVAAGIISMSRHEVKPGDLVRCHITAELKDGSLIYTTDAARAGKTGAVKAAVFREPPCFNAIDIIAGEEGPVPGLRDALIGMHAGEQRTLVLPPEKAFGKVDKSMLKTYDCVKISPRIVTMKAREYVDTFETIPSPGDVVSLNPYFPARVVKVSAREVQLENQPKDGELIDGTFGPVMVTVKGDTISVAVKPAIGARFVEADGREGVIVAADDKKFTVDLNPPLAGKDIVLTVEAASIIDKAKAEKMSIPWTEGHEEALARAKREGKPLVLVLYAEWCQFSQQYLHGILADARIRVLSGSFVWSRIDTDKERDIYGRYKQNGYPLTVILSPEGKELHRMRGMVDAVRLQQALACIAAGQTVREPEHTGDALQPLEGHCPSEQ